MARRMSCSMTIEAVRERRKTVTRRHVDTWTTLRAGDRLTLVEKAMGLPKGAKQVVLAEVEVLSNDVDILGNINPDECRREGFPEMSPDEFRRFWAKGHNYGSVLVPVGGDDLLRIPCRRIEWRYLDEVVS